MAPLWARADEERRGSFSRENRGRDAGILIGSIVAIIVLVQIVTRLCGYRLCGRRRRSPSANGESNRESNRPVHLNSAQVMQLCARRDRMAKDKEKALLNVSEIDVMAPVTVRRGALTIVTMETIPEVKTTELSLPAAAVLSKSSRPKNPDEPAWTAAANANSPPICDSNVEQGLSGDSTNSTLFDGDYPLCCICLERFEDSEPIRATRCSHVFHGHCLEKWLTKYHNRCPLCQENLKPKGQSPEIQP